MGIFDIFSTEAQERAAEAQKAGLNAGYGQAADLYGQGRGALTNYYGAALQPFQQVFDQSQAGSRAYADATGAGGAAGLQSAYELFKQTPGYQSGFDLLADANDRRQSSRGMLASGNTLADTAKLATTYADQNYGNYVSRLSPFLGQSTASAGGLAGVNTGLGSQLNASLGNQGQLAYQTQTGIGNANANAELASLNASGNIFNALMGGASLGAFLLSDVDLKTDIEPVGELFDGQQVYRYRYVADPDTVHIGLIAQEVEEVEPEAVARIAGFRAVDYGRATDLAAGLSGFL